MVDCDGLENRYPLIADRGFESHSLLQIFAKILSIDTDKEDILILHFRLSVKYS